MDNFYHIWPDFRDAAVIPAPRRGPLLPCRRYKHPPLCKSTGIRPSKNRQNRRPSGRHEGFPKCSCESPPRILQTVKTSPPAADPGYRMDFILYIIYMLPHCSLALAARNARLRGRCRTVRKMIYHKDDISSKCSFVKGCRLPCGYQCCDVFPLTPRRAHHLRSKHHAQSAPIVPAREHIVLPKQRHRRVAVSLFCLWAIKKIFLWFWW